MESRTVRPSGLGRLESTCARSLVRFTLNGGTTGRRRLDQNNYFALVRLRARAKNNASNDAKCTSIRDRVLDHRIHPPPSLYSYAKIRSGTRR